MNSILHYFPNTDMRQSHIGLTLVAKKSGIDPDRLKKGSFILFVNRSKTHIKIMAAGNVLVHYRSPNGRVDLGAIQYLPLAFSGNEFNFNNALRAKLEKDLAKKRIAVRTTP